MSEQDTHRRLHAEADYFYVADDWETTHHDLGGICEQTALHCDHTGEVIEVGRLKQISYAYAVNVPISFDDDGDPDEWELKLFESREAASAAYAEAMSAARAALEQG